MGTIYKSQKSTASQFPSHAGMNARSGLPGFLRVSPSDGRTIVLPDYSGNRFVSSLGNIEATGLVGFTIVSFTTGDVLYMTGTAKNIVGQEALKIMKKHAAITVMQVSGFTFVKDAMPLRQQVGTSVERSPYSPKVKYLVEESGAESSENADYKAVLESAVQLSENLAVFKFSVPPHKGSKKLEIRPGQAIALDFMDWIGPPQYQHMSNAKPSLINDDRIRTWTVSSAHEDGEASWFELTMRELKGGTVTGTLFDLLRQSNTRYGTPVTPRNPVIAEVVGITGDFYLGQNNINALWVAGGIGVTPFLSMLSALSTRNRSGGCDITLALATKEPVLMVNLLRPLLARLPSDIRIVIDIFTHVKGVHLDRSQRKSQKLSIHRGRIPAEYWIKTAENKDVLICGPGGFGDSVTEGLQAAGVPLERIQREGFY
jgi:ferredoxin-NADP reductase